MLNCLTHQLSTKFSINFGTLSQRHASSGHVQYMSKLFLPSSNQKSCAQHDKLESNQNVDLLINNGMIHMMSSGHFALLPMMRTAFDKLVSIIDQEMKAIGAQKCLLPNVYSTKYLEISERFEQFQGEVYMFEDKSGISYYLAPTHEEAITSIVGNCTPFGKKRLPLLLYQMDTKFRDELRPKFGLMRTKEFVMKDLYTFHNSEQCAMETYAKVCQAYMNIFQRLQLPVYKAQASTGTMGGKYSHEFLVVNENGEDHMWLCDSCGVCFNEELLPQQSKEKCSNCNGNMKRQKAIEVGHTFFLGTRYSEKFKANFKLDDKLSPYLMSCYGLGITRILGVLMDNCSSSNQIRWPTALAPFDVSIIMPKAGSKEEQSSNASLLSQQLAEQFMKQFDMNVLLDDRGEKSIGWKLKQHKSIGIPCTVVLGKRLSEPTPLYEFSDNCDAQTKWITQAELFHKLRNKFV